MDRSREPFPPESLQAQGAGGRISDDPVSALDRAALGSLRTRLGLYLAFVSLALGYYAIAIALGLDPRGQFGSAWLTSLSLSAVLVPLYAGVAILGALLQRPWNLPGLRVRLRKRLWSREALERVVGMIVLLAGNMLVFDVFAAYKPAIPTFQPYIWDSALADLDRALHFGQDPWIWLHTIPFRDLVTAILDWLYLQWYFVMTFVLIAVLLVAPLKTRVCFYIGFALLWALGGSLIGTLFASGGPVYFAQFTGDANRFAPLLSYLRQAAPTATALQDHLWSAYLTADADVAFEGISAMPSLHVATAAYFAFWTSRIGRAWGLLGASYAFLILLGSVHLGWHYALDGYVGIALAWVSFRLADFLSRPGGPAASSPREEAPGAWDGDEPSLSPGPTA